MAKEGLEARGGEYKDLFRNLEEKLNWWDTFKVTWSKSMNEPTFKRFLPQLNVSFFKDTYDQAIKQGMDKAEAQKLAGDASKNFYGIQETIGRSNTTSDALNTVFFAPRFREGMIGFWKNNIGALKPSNIGNKAYNNNRKFLIGTVVTYGLYNALNKKLNDRWLWENKPGKEFYLEIPTNNPKQRSIFIPILPSIGTIPRKVWEAGKALSEGDMRTVTQKATGFLSQPASLAGQVLTNKNYFGGPIADYDDDTKTKIAKLVGYTLGEVTHPFIAEPLAVIQGRRTIPEAVLLMMELPTYPSRSSIFIRKDNQKVYEKLLAAGKDKNKVKAFIKYQQDLDDLSSVKYKKMANQLIAKGKQPDKVLKYVTYLSDKNELEKKIDKIKTDKDLTLEEKKKKALPLIRKLKKLN